ncbi:hypothetical protein GCK72_004620 [Caenorhabditis remanei]|uniref:Uncharacterized protein n=1 Tax=Caenorhabditis remanei TaxID=31234 RepID=A0A6A5HCM6_CAERE|nr:hypothetical protein GCK72_004620 [Caenorhabditis remanei]KAF1764671.1 hypothetical protein GCK72_004620 [Caenorhabditis remanei]
MTLSTIATPERSMHHQNITAPRSSPPNTRKNGFLSTLASYLTSTAKSDPKPVTQRKPLMTSWNDVDFVKLNSLVCNVLYDQNNYEPLITEIERVVGRRREHCFYGVLSVILVLVLLHDAIGAITAFMTLILPTFMTVTAISTSASYENPSFLKDHQDFSSVIGRFTRLIHWDLRLLRLIFMSMCLSTRIPVLAATYTKILNAVSAIRQIIDNNNFEKAPPPQSVTILAVKTKTS